MKRLVALFILYSATIPTALTAQNVKGPFYYLSPVPGAEHVRATTTLIFRPQDEFRRLSPDWMNHLEVRGTSSGRHVGDWVRARDGRTFIFRPAHPFAHGERVDVTLPKTHGISFATSFQIASRPPVPDPDDLRLLCDCATGPQGAPPNPRIDTGNFPRDRTTEGGFQLPPDFPLIQAVTFGETSPGHTFISNFGWPPFVPGPDEPGRYMMILDNTGDPVFFRRARDLFVADFKVLSENILSYYSYPITWFYLMDQTYTVFDSVTTIDYSIDFHDILLLPNGNFLMFAHDNQPRDMSGVVEGGDPDAFIVEIVIQELDPDRNVVFEWHSDDYFDIMDAPHYDYTQQRIDYIHPNSLHLDDDGNILMSNRHMDEVTKISRDTGDLIWRLGGNNNEFTMDGNGQWFSHQHSARRQANGHVTLFDNGNWNDPRESRAVEYVLDVDNMTVAQVWEYRNTPEQFSSAMGNVQRFDNGNTLVGWGSSGPNVTEVRPDGSKAMEIAFEDGLVSYRAFRFEWEGKAAVPFLWAEKDSIDATLHFTRFGDDAVETYIVYQGATPEALTPIGSTPDNRFDVGRLRPGTAYFRVTAVDEGGVETGYSNVDSVTVDMQIVSASASVEPRTLNLKSQGKWISARIEMGEDSGCDARDIDIASLRVENIVPAEWRPVSYGDDDGDGVEELKVKFSRGAVASILDPGQRVPLEISGVAAGNFFVATAQIRVIDPGSGNKAQSSLGPNTPNPFNPSTAIPYRIAPPGGPARIMVFDAAGRRIRTLVDGDRAPGSHSVTWNGRDQHGQPVASGIYFVRFEAAGVAETRKIVLLK